MSPDNNPIVIIPMENFRWRPRVRFMESFPTRTAALSYAFQHDCNLIVENNEGSIVLYDVMQDPNRSCTAGLDLELMTTENVLVEPAPGGWTALMLQTLWDLAKRFAAFLATFDTRQVVPFCQRAAIVANAYLRQVVPLSRRAAIIANTYLRQVVSFSRRAAIVANAHLRQVVPFSRRAAIIPHTYRRQDVPFSRRVAIVANRHLREAALFYRRTTNFASLFAREIAPILRNSAVKCWSESKGVTLRHSRNVLAPHRSFTSQLH